MLNLNPGDVNELRRLLAAGAITEEQLSGMSIGGRFGGSPAPVGPSPQNELARILSPQEEFAQGGGEGDLPMGSMRNEATGKVTYFKPGGGGFSAQPYPANAAPQARPKMRVVGFGNGQATDLGEEDARAMPVDFTRPGIEIPGLGKGRYTADGRYAVIQGPNGEQTKVVLGYDAAASDRRNDRDLKRRLAEAGLAAREESLGMMRDRRQILAAGPKRTMTDAMADGPPKPEKMTESQAKALGFGMRAANSSEILDLVGEGGEIQPGLIKRSAEAIPLVGEGLGTALNWTQSPEQQQVEQAQRDFINAILRRESGAVISDSEFSNARAQYFPQPGDSPEVIKQKRRNRALAIEGFSQEVEPVRPGMIKGAAAKARALFEARKAIQQGADPAAVQQRLRQMGVNESEL